MLRLKKRIDGYLKFPLMWVMLLWAFTLPGHEVRVYNFLLHTLAGKPVPDLVHAREEVSRTEKQAEHASLEAAPATSFAGKIKFQLLDAVSGGRSFSLVKSVTFLAFSGSGFNATTFKAQLLIALLPNAP